MKPHSLILGLVLSLWPGLAFAHPDLFIDPRLDIIGENDQVQRIHVEWTFDSMFSATLFQDHPRPKNGTYEGKALARIKSGAFDNLVNYGYYLLVNVNGKPFKVKSVNNFTARVAKNNLVYGFDVELPGSPPIESLTVTMVDQDNYTAFNEYQRELNALVGLPEGSAMEYAVVPLKTPRWGVMKPQRITLRLP
jgi:ABC-type uncharacterized transport system substrate-binding protein